MRKRLVIVSALSLAVGAAGGYLYAHAPRARQRVAEAPELPARETSRIQGGNSATPPLAQAANAPGTAVLRLVAGTPADTLPSLLADALASPESAAKELLIQAIALRAAELEGGRALEWLGSLALDPRAALTVGLALFDSLGPSAEQLAQILKALPTLDERRFRVEALAHWARVAPERALQNALALDEWSLRGNAVARVAAAWAETDLDGALAEGELLPDDNFGRAFRSAVVRHLGEANPGAMVAYVNGSPGRQSELTRAVLDEISLTEPEQALELAEQLHGAIGKSARSVALRNWAQTSPLAAFAYAQGMPLGDERVGLLHDIARGYGRQDPDGALAWARTLTAAPPDLLGSVIAGIAEVDARRALDLAFSSEVPVSNVMGLSRGRMNMINSVANYIVSNHEMPVPELVERLLTLQDFNERHNALRFVTMQWLADDPEQAFEWLTTADQIPAMDANLLISSFAQRDPTRAANYTARVPEQLRDIWIANVAQNYARLDPSAAVAWLRQYRDEPGYSAGLSAIVMRVAEADVSQAASLFSELPATDANTPRVAEALGNQWAATNLANAKLWAARLPEGATRDAALRGLINNAYRDAIPDDGLLRLFSSEEVRQQAILTTIYSIGQKDRDAARRLAEQHITLPRLRAQADQWLDSTKRPGVVVYPGGFITTQ